MKLKASLAILLFFPFLAIAQLSLQKMYPPDFSKVAITDPFWKGKQDLVSTTTLNTCILYTEKKTGTYYTLTWLDKRRTDMERHESVKISP